MQTKEIRIIISEFENLSELPANDQQLVVSARKVAKNAYAPYSKFNVGAAIELDNGKTITGSNQENAASPSGLCAERVALFFANSKYPETVVKTIAITAFNDSEHVHDAVSPCGACRQVMAETENRFGKPIRIILDGKQKIRVFESTNDLLPFSFNSNSLKKPV